MKFRVELQQLIGGVTSPRVPLSLEAACLHAE